MNMKKFPIYALAAMALLSLAGCKDDYEEYDNSYLLDYDQTMTLSASSDYVELDAEALDEDVLTFTWTPARQMPDDYIVQYITEIDLADNDFTSAKREYENPDVFSRSYTTEELQELITVEWGKSDKDEALLAFRVIATWDGGTKYVMPEVCSTQVIVRPYRPLTFDADYVYLEGTALTGTTRQPVGRTLEDEYKYAIVQTAKAGKLDIAIEYEGVTSYIVPQMPAAFQSGAVVPAVVSETPDESAWNIPSDGDYRIIIDILNKTVTMYSPDDPFNTNFSIKWYAFGRPALYPVMIETEISSTLWTRGEQNGWSEGDSKVLNLTQSAADPQVLVYSGAAIGSGRTHFPILPHLQFDATGDGVPEDMNFNTMAVVAPPRVDEDGDGIHDLHDKGKGPDQNVVLGTWQDFDIGSDLREVYWDMPSGVNYMVFDFRNMKVKLEKR